MKSLDISEMVATIVAILGRHGYFTEVRTLISGRQCVDMCTSSDAEEKAHLVLDGLESFWLVLDNFYTVDFDYEKHGQVAILEEMCSIAIGYLSGLISLKKDSSSGMRISWNGESISFDPAFPSLIK